MITYATSDEFMSMKDIGKTGLMVVSSTSVDKIDDYLQRATRYIERATRRYFVPRFETREYAVPYSFYDLAVRRYPQAHLTLDMDLLEVTAINSGNTSLTSSDYYLLEHNIYPKHIVALNYPNYWGNTTLGRYDAPVISITGFWGYADFGYPSEHWIDTTQVVEAGGIDATQTVITIVDSDTDDDLGLKAFQKGGLLRVDDELMEIILVNAPLDNQVTVRRGVRGTTAVAHDVDTVIYRWRVIDDIKEVCLQVAKTWREADVSAGGRIGVSDVSPGAELSIPEDPLSILKSYHRTLLFG